MAKSPTAPINPRVLMWARSACGYTPEELVKKIKVKLENYLSWENGQDKPSFSQLKKIADVLKRPSAVFFMSVVPKDHPVPTDFRVIDDADIKKLAPKTLVEIRKAQRKRDLAIELAKSIEEPIISFQDTIDLNDDIAKVAAKYRKKFLINDYQEKGWTSEYQALNAWKRGIEGMGILVFQASLDNLEEMRGLAIYNRILPIILLNTKDSPRGKIFSMLHEFCHLLLRKSGIGNIDANWGKPDKINRIEVFCNEFAGQCMLPGDLLADIASRLDSKTLVNDRNLQAIVRKFQVSWEVALRRLLEETHISASLYKSRRQELIAFFKSREKPKKGGAVPIEQKALSYNGEYYTSLVLNSFDQEKITSADIIDYLGVGYKHIEKLKSSIVKKAEGA